MSDCRLTEKVKELLKAGGEIHNETAVRMPDRMVWKVKLDGSLEELWQASAPDAPRQKFRFDDI